MKRRLETLSWATLILERRFPRLNPTPAYQRDSVWTKRQKQLLIDSIILNLDIPKLYFRLLTTDPDYDYEIIDGQQRVRAIYEFRTNQFELSDDYTPDYGDLYYRDLPEDLKDHIDMYTLDIVVIEEATDGMIREMFLRLQNGTQLSAAEKRNAMGGVVHDFAESLVQDYPVISSLQKYRIRQFHQETAAQCILLELQGEGTILTDKYIVDMYETYRRFDLNGPVANRVRRVMAFLQAALGEDTLEVRSRTQFVSLYYLVSSMIDDFDLSEREEAFKDFVMDFERRCREDEHDPLTVDKYLNGFKQTPQQWESIKARHDALTHAWLLFAPDLPTRDGGRTFNTQQRMAIYRRDRGVCQICGEAVSVKGFDVNHVVPHSQGGKTTVANGQIAHRLCSVQKIMTQDVAG